MRGHLPTACTSGVANQRRRSARSILIQRPSSRRWNQSSSCGDFGAAGCRAGLARPGRPSMPSGAHSAHHRQWRSCLRPQHCAASGWPQRGRRRAQPRPRNSLGEADPIALRPQTFRDPCPARSFVPPYRGADPFTQPLPGPVLKHTWNGISNSGTFSAGLRRSPFMAMTLSFS